MNIKFCLLRDGNLVQISGRVGVTSLHGRQLAGEHLRKHGEEEGRNAVAAELRNEEGERPAGDDLLVIRNKDDLGADVVASISLQFSNTGPSGA